VTVLRAFGCDSALSDHYAKQWVAQAFGRHGITLVAAPDKSTCYLELEPVIARGALALLDHPQQTRELSLLERHARPGGKPYIDHPRSRHDDHANALALACYAALQAAQPAIDTTMSEDEYRALRRIVMHPGEISGLNPEEVAGSFLSEF
jgi:hypothetical protein